MTPRVIRALERAGIARTEDDVAAGWKLAQRCVTEGPWMYGAVREAAQRLSLALIVGDVVETESAAADMLAEHCDGLTAVAKRQLREIRPAPRGPAREAVRRGGAPRRRP